MEVLHVNSSKVALKKTMTVKDLCSEYNIGLNKCYEIINHKDFPKIRCGRKILIIRSKVDEWIEKHIGEVF